MMEVRVAGHHHESVTSLPSPGAGPLPSLCQRLHLSRRGGGVHHPKEIWGILEPSAGGSVGGRKEATEQPRLHRARRGFGTHAGGRVQRPRSC